MKTRAGLALLVLAVVSLTPPTGARAVETAPTTSVYTNPVSAGTVDTFPDPAVIKGKDGSWYAYGTTNPIFNSQGETGEHILPILSSPDLVHWTYRQDVYALTGKPSYWASGTRAWAPDIRYLDGGYYLTYALSNGGVALLTGATPLGPWTDHGLLVKPADSGCPTGTIDQALFTDTDGTNYLYWGSYDTLCVQQLSADATARVGAVTQVGRGRRAEGSFVVHRGGFYYLFFSDAGCCDGAFSGYTVKVGRSTSPRGPFVTPSGLDLMALTSKDGIVLSANGNRWIGPGHNAIATDLAGQDWLVYHGISSADPDFGPVTGANGATLNLTRRPLLIDRLDWIDGWPVVRAGAGPSDTPQAAPVTTPAVDARTGWDTTWPSAVDPDSGDYLTAAKASFSLSARAASGDVRVEGDVRAGAGLVISYTDERNHVVAWLDPASNRLDVATTVRGKRSDRTAALPAGFSFGTWHNVAAERRGRNLTVEVSADRLRDAVATVSLTLPAAVPLTGRIGASATAAGAAADNLGATALYRPVTQRVADPVLGAQLPAYSDEFTGTDPAWSWIRGTNDTVLTGGALAWPTQNAELYTTTNTASVLVRDAPAGDFTVETKLTFDGTRGNQQAGLVLYQNDDRWFKLAHSVLPLAGTSEVTHQVEFGKEGERGAVVANAPIFGGPAAGTTWLRLRYHYDAANGEDEVREASSVDGTTWTWGGTWTLAHTGAYRIGLVSMNASGATASFDYVRTYR
ncbi:family 43 glycosylhydrolase [Actinoplanes sp. L3-i22]|uniref:family 43 glycosylhydrolase n=1 Tax=Actinoplanes sp. L3-i22 TaxID=2836373 RepID=UPI001C840E04|nr:family 43 glycosylhydrolase [Actinoplanes sp. L3-i22]